MASAPDTRAAISTWARAQQVLQRLLPLALSALVMLAAIPLAGWLTEDVGALRKYGIFAYPLLFLLQTIFSATLFLPAPGLAFVAAAGTFLDPFWVGVMAGLGSATGELSGYLLGYYGRRAVPTDTSRLWRLSEHTFRSWGFVALMVLACIPNPVFDAVGILAGGLRYPIFRFWLATAVGKVTRSLLIAYGAALVNLWMRVGG